MMKIDVLTLFPGMFGGALCQSILKIARDRGHLDLTIRNIRDWADGRHRTVDDKPYGGGAGMVMKPEPVVRCVEHALEARGGGARVALLSPRGRRFDQAFARELAAEEHLILVCGHYEGFDERIRIELDAEEVSVGDFVLSGGEIAALVIVDAVTRLLPGVLGSSESLFEESFNEEGVLEYPQYTRPEIYRGMPVPEVLRSGHHEKIREWRAQEARKQSPAHRVKEQDDEAT